MMVSAVLGASKFVVPTSPQFLE